MPMTRMLTRITSTITIFHMTPLLRSEEEVEVRRDTGDISVMVDVECENDRIDPWAEANISAFLTGQGNSTCHFRMALDLSPILSVYLLMPRGRPAAL